MPPGYIGAVPTSLAITLRHPTLDEMSLRQAWLADRYMMSFNRGWALKARGYDNATGCLEFPPDVWPAWYDAWVRQPSDRNYWFIDLQGHAVGHAFFRLDTQDGRVAHVGVNVVPAQRGRGLGVSALGLLLDEIRRDGRAAVAVNEFEDTRVAAVRLHRALGFRRTASVGPAPDGSTVGRWELPLR